MKLKKYVVNFSSKLLLLIILVYTCTLPASANSSKQISALHKNNSHNENNFDQAKKYFLIGAKEGGIVVSTVYCFVLIPILYSDYIPDFSSKSFNYINSIVMNPIVVLYLFIVEPLIETFFYNYLIQNAFNDILENIAPDNLSNKQVYDNLLKLSQKNIPLVNNLIHCLLHKVKSKHQISSSSSSFVKDTTSSAILGTICILINYYKNPILGIIKTSEIISRSIYYRDSGYLPALSYKTGFNSALYLVSATFSLFFLAFQ